MEAGLVLAVASLIDPLIRLGRNSLASWKQSSNFGIDAEKLRVHFKRERRQIEAIRHLLLTRAEGLGVDTTVFEQFKDLWQADLLDELRQLRAMTRGLEEIEQRYHIFAGPHSATTQGQLPTEEVVNLALLEDREVDFYRAATKSQLMLWGVRDGKRAAKLLDDLHRWVELFKEDIEMYLWASFQTPDTLQGLHRNADVAALGFAGAVELRQILIRTIDPSGRFEAKARPNIGTKLGDSSALGKYQNQPAIIEFKSYSPDADAATVDRTTRRVCQLAALLSRPQSPEAGPSLRVLPCAGYYIEPAEDRYTFIYRIPPGLDPQPVTLLSCLQAGEQKYRSTIKHRFRLAHILSVSLYQLHRVGWVHKSLRSENILFFPSGHDAGTAVPDAIIDRQTKRTYLEPWLIGFEYARVLSQDSDLAATDTSVAKNIYRHPERWNAPTHKFGPVHDIYALGAVLLEIGLWRSLLTLSETGFARAADAAAPDEVRDSVKVQLVQHATRKIPYHLGSVYCEIIKLCLTGDLLEAGGSDTDIIDHTALNKAFREKVVDRLAILSAGI